MFVSGRGLLLKMGLVIAKGIDEDWSPIRTN
jgi:hypothetical protein